MKVSVTLPHNSLVNIRVILKMNINYLWKTRRNWQELFGNERANRLCNNDIRETIHAYRDICDYTILP